ncbi:MAG: SGNH/GDSL hydrolase family protein [Victivallaceae bacterium]
MSGIKSSWRILLSFVVLLAAAGMAFAADPVVKNGDRLAIAGDSITEQKIYTRYIEAYLLACAGLKDIKVFQFGWGGERASGFVARMENDTWSWRPTVITTCYGMNDGGYRAYDEKIIGAVYRDNMKKIVDFFKDKGVKVIVGSPGVVDSETYKRFPGAAVYNENLSKLALIDREIAQAANVGFADVNTVMMTAMTAAKARLGGSFHVAGPDGVHPAADGQLLMAYAFLKAMGFDGRIAAISMDFNGQTSVSAGHAVITRKPGMVEIESARYPFCFTGKPDDPAGTVSILPFVPFQQDLNRFELKVSNLPSAKAEVNWGGQKKVFSKDELEKGINLAAEFIDNPFSAQFKLLQDELGSKQNHETWMIKGIITNIRLLATLPDADKDPKMKESAEYLRMKLMARQAELDAKVKSCLQPVKHQITVNPIN